MKFIKFIKGIKNIKSIKSIKKYQCEMLICITLILIFTVSWSIKLNSNTEKNIDDKTEEQNENISDLHELLPFKHPLKIVNMSISLNDINDISDDEAEKIEEKEEVENIPSYDKYEFVNGWIIEAANIKVEPNFDSGILEVYSHNKQIEYAQYNEEWSVIKYEDDYAFVQNKHISNEVCNYNFINIPAYSEYKGNKTWMPYAAISCIESPQYKLQQIAYTGTYGIRMYDGRYCIAVGTAITSDVGVYIDIILENGTVIPCIVGDIKADIHTSAENIFTLNSICCSEFIVDMNHLDPYVKLTGNVSKACTEWDSKVAKFKVYNDVDIVDW